MDGTVLAWPSSFVPLPCLSATERYQSARWEFLAIHYGSSARARQEVRERFEFSRLPSTCGQKTINWLLYSSIFVGASFDSHRRYRDLEQILLENQPPSESLEGTSALVFAALPLFFLLPMSYNNVIGGKLKLKGKALDVKAGGVKKKKKKENKESFEQTLLQLKENEEPQHGSDAEEKKGSSVDGDQEQGEGGNERQLPVYEDHRTPAEKKYDEQKIALETQRLAKVASKSHRQKIEEFNQYLANLSEHYDIPKVGPG